MPLALRFRDAPSLSNRTTPTRSIWRLIREQTQHGDVARQFQLVGVELGGRERLFSRDTHALDGVPVEPRRGLLGSELLDVALGDSAEIGVE